MKKQGDGRRVQKVEKEVHETVADYFIRYMTATPDVEGLLTVTRVMMAADLRSAKIYITVFIPDADESLPKTHKKKEEITEYVQSRAFDIQDHISSKLKMRYCPKLTFFLDESMEKILKIERTLSDLEKARAPK